MEIFFILFQGIMLILLYLTLLTRSIMLYVKDGINPFVLGKGKKGFDAILELLFFGGLFIWSYEIISHLMTFQFHVIPIQIINEILIDNFILKFIGILFLLSGYVIFIFSLIAFGKSWRVGIDKDNPGKLITGGIFSITRNPIFVFLDLYFIGTTLLNTNPFFIILSILVITGIHYQILQEEKFLKQNYGTDYVEYMKRVRRYL